MLEFRVEGFAAREPRILLRHGTASFSSPTRTADRHPGRAMARSSRSDRGAAPL